MSYYLCNHNIEKLNQIILEYMKTTITQHTDNVVALEAFQHSNNTQTVDTLDPAKLITFNTRFDKTNGAFYDTFTLNRNL